MANVPDGKRKIGQKEQQQQQQGGPLKKPEENLAKRGPVRLLDYQ